MRYKLAITYDGTSFSGWQRQPNGTSIQELLETALSTCLREPIRLTGSGRTDAGVHALCQIAHFDTEKKLIPFRFIHSCNCLLPPLIRVIALEETFATFHARYSATSKIYRYRLTLNPTQIPFERLYQWHVKGKCDLQRLKDLKSVFIGTHDFSSFANESTKGAAAKNPIRTLKRVDLIEKENGLEIELESNGFLYKMVRNIVGTLVDSAQKELSKEALMAILQKKDRKCAGRSAPAHGLFLVAVNYTDLQMKKNAKHLFL